MSNMSLGTLAEIDVDETFFPEGDDLYRPGATVEKNIRMRAGWAVEPVLVMARATGILSERFNEDVAVAIADLIGNVAHLCDVIGADREDVFRAALMNYEAEQVEL